MNFLPGPMELVLILVIVAMLFGVGKLPEVFGAVGKGIKEFRKEATDTGSKPAETAPVPAPLPAAVMTQPAVVEGTADKVEQA